MFVACCLRVQDLGTLGLWFLIRGSLRLPPAVIECRISFLSSCIYYSKSIPVCQVFLYQIFLSVTPATITLSTVVVAMHLDGNHASGGGDDGLDGSNCDDGDGFKHLSFLCCFLYLVYIIVEHNPEVNSFLHKSFLYLS